MTKPLNPTDIKPRGYFSTDYQAVLPGGVSADEALKPEFWSHINSQTPPKLRRFDRIQVIPEDESCFLDLIVLASGKGFAKVALVQRVDLDAAADPVELRLTEAIWRGPSLRWTVERKSDNQRLKTGFQSRREAEIAARDYELVTA